jgi:hypothetical protein
LADLTIYSLFPLIKRELLLRPGRIPYQINACPDWQQNPADLTV